MTQEAKLRVIVDGKAAVDGSKVVIQSLETMNRVGRDSNKIFNDMTSSMKSMGGVADSLGKILKIAIPVAIIVEFGKALYDTTNRMQGFVSTMSVVTNSASRAREEFGYLFEVANRWGVQAGSIIDAYSKLSAAAKGTALEGKGVREVFEAITKASSAMHLSTEDTRLVFFALQQMVSKGKVSMEELRKQLAERFPGAVTLAAQSMGVTVDVMEKMIRSGQVLAAEFLPNFARAISEAFDESATVSTRSLQAEISRLFNAWEMFKVTMAESGVIEAASAMVRTLTEMLSGQNAAAMMAGDILRRLIGYTNDFIKSLKPDDIQRFVTIVYEGFSAIVTVFGALINLAQLAVSVLTPIGKVLSYIFEGPIVAIKALINLTKVVSGEISFKEWARGQDAAALATQRFGASNDDVRDKLAQRNREERRLVENQQKQLSQASAAFADSERSVAIKTKEITAVERLRDLDEQRKHLKAELSDRDLAPERRIQVLQQLTSMSKEYGTVSVQAHKEQAAAAKESLKASEDLSKAKEKEYQDADRRLEQLTREGVKLSENKLLEDLAANALAASTIQNKAAREATLERLNAQAYVNNELRNAAKAEEELMEAYQNEMKAVDQKIEKIDDQIKKLREENEEIGLTKDQIRQLEIVRIDEQIATLQGNLAKQESAFACTEEAEKTKILIEKLQQLKALRSDNDRLKDQDELAKGWAKEVKGIEREMDRAAENMYDGIVNAFLRGAKRGKDIFQDLRESLTNLFDNLVLKPMIQAGVTFLAGGSGSAFANVVGGGGSGFNLGALFNNGSGIMGAAVPSWLGGSAWNQSSSNFMGPPDPSGGGFFDFGGGLQGVLGGAGVGAGIGGLMSGFMPARRQTGAQTGAMVGGMIGSVVPVIGTILGSVIGSLVGSLFKSGGGPKVGGSSTNIGGRLFTPDQRDSEMIALANQQTGLFSQMVRRLGGRGNAMFDFGFDMDPEGDANSRVSAIASVGGRTVYSGLDVDAGRDDAQLKSALELEAKRALLAALQASDLPQDVADVLDMLTANTASGSDIDRTLKFAEAVGMLATAMDEGALEGGLTAFSDSLLGVESSISRQLESVMELRDEFDGSADAATELAGATSGLYEATVRAIAGIEKMKADLSDMFGDSIRNFRMSPMDNEGKFNFLRSENVSIADRLATETDSASIARLAQDFNANLNAMFGLLSPEQQSAQWQEFVRSAEEARELVNTSLTEAQNKMATQITAMVTEVRTALMEAAAAQQAAANTSLAAGELQVQAANTPVQVVVNQPVPAYDVTGG